MLQKPPLERVVGNDNNTTPKTAHETCKNIATKTENTSEVSKDGASAESSDAPEKAQFTCDSEQIKKNQDTEHVTENLLTNNAKQLNGSSSEHSGATNSSETDIKENIRLVELINTIFLLTVFWGIGCVGNWTILAAVFGPEGCESRVTTVETGCCGSRTLV